MADLICRYKRELRLDAVFTNSSRANTDNFYFSLNLPWGKEEVDTVFNFNILYPGSIMYSKQDYPSFGHYPTDTFRIIFKRSTRYPSPVIGHAFFIGHVLIV